MSKDKRKAKHRQARVAKKKASSVNKLKTARRAHARKPHPVAKRREKDLKRAKKIVVAKPKAAPQKTEAKKAKTPIKSAKHALELLDARLAGLKKSKGGRPGRKGRKEEWLLAAAAQLPKEDAETRRTRLKNLIKLGKDRGFLTYSEINDHLPDDLVDAEQIEAIISTFGDMGIQVYDQAPDQETLLIS